MRQQEEKTLLKEIEKKEEHMVFEKEVDEKINDMRLQECATVTTNPDATETTGKRPHYVNKCLRLVEYSPEVSGGIALEAFNGPQGAEWLVRRTFEDGLVIFYRGTKPKHEILDRVWLPDGTMVHYNEDGVVIRRTRQSRDTTLCPDGNVESLPCRPMFPSWQDLVHTDDMTPEVAFNARDAMFANNSDVNILPAQDVEAFTRFGWGTPWPAICVNHDIPDDIAAELAAASDQLQERLLDRWFAEEGMTYIMPDGKRVSETVFHDYTNHVMHLVEKALGWQQGMPFTSAQGKRIMTETGAPGTRVYDLVALRASDMSPGPHGRPLTRPLPPEPPPSEAALLVTPSVESPSTDGLRVGSAVRAAGLRRQDLNNRAGTIVALAESGRWVVRFGNDQALSKVKPENLVLEDVFQKDRAARREKLTIAQRVRDDRRAAEQLARREAAAAALAKRPDATPPTPTRVSLRELTLCPLSREPMTDAVLASDGYTYSAKALHAFWGRTDDFTSPLTGAPISAAVVPHFPLMSLGKEVVQRPHFSQHQIPFEEPEVLLCPITQEVMDDPVRAADGQVYQRSALQQWLSVKVGKETSPVTNSPMAPDMRDDLTLKCFARAWL